MTTRPNRHTGITHHNISQREGRDRDRRLFANIQSTLRGTSSVSSPVPLNNKLKPRIKDPVEKLHDLSEIISQISDLTLRSDRSAIQIKRNITSSDYLLSMGEDDWITLCKTLLAVALNDSETDFVVDLFIPLMAHELFCEVMCSELMSISSSFIMDNDESEENIPPFLGAILCANWPRSMSKAIDSINPVLYTTVSVIKGWLLVLTEDNIATNKELEDNSSEKSSSQREDHEIVNRCARAISSLCDSTQRSLWMKWPELCDEIYSVIKPSITDNQVITGDVKTSLLNSLITLHSWTRSRVHTTKNVSTQTVKNVT